MSTTNTMGRAALIMLRDGLAVLTAILIAFSLDAWWGDREEARRTRALLVAIEAEFRSAVTQLDSVLANNRLGVEYLVRLTLRTSPGSPPIPTDSLRLLVDYPDREIWIQWDPAFGALPTLIATGGLERIEDAELQSAIVGWTGELEDLEDSERMLEFGAQRLFLALAAASAIGDPTAVGAPADLERLRRVASSREFHEATQVLLFALAEYQRDLTRVRDRTRILADELTS